MPQDMKQLINFVWGWKLGVLYILDLGLLLSVIECQLYKNVNSMLHYCSKVLLGVSSLLNVINHTSYSPHR